MRRVAIVGFAPSTREAVNNLDPLDWEIWGLNAAHRFLKLKPRYWFQIHHPRWREGRDLKRAGIETGTYGRGLDHLEFLRTCGIPVWQLQTDPRLPTSRLYPRELVIATIRRDYLTSSFAYAMGLALHEGVDEIAFYGCDLVSTIEFAHQRPNLEWLIGLAEGRGIKVTLPQGGLLLEGPSYPDREDERVRAAERVVYWKNEYMVGWQGFAFAIGALYEAQRTGDSDRIAFIEEVLGRVSANVHESGGGLSEALRNLEIMGIADVYAPQLPKLVRPPNFLEDPPLVKATAEEVPA